MALHVYGVVPAGFSVPEGLTGVRTGTVRVVGEGDLAALVSDVPDDYKASLQDTPAHLSVLIAAVGGPVVPLLFATVVPHERAVIDDVLTARAPELRGELAARLGMVEIHVDVGRDEQARLRQTASEDPEIQAILRHLRPWTASDCARGRADGWVMRWAFLVSRDDLAGFDRALRKVHDRYGGTRAITRVGPLPVLRFSAAPQAERSRWGW